jgi:hypothetical protein
MWRFISFCTHEIDSTPPATNTSPSPAITRCAASAIVCNPDEQKRFTVMPGTLTGKPARNAICRAMLPPVAPSGFAQPMITSSTRAGSSFARSTAACVTWPPSVAPCVMLKPPRHDLARPVRAVDTITASVMHISYFQMSMVARWQIAARITLQIGRRSAPPQSFDPSGRRPAQPLNPRPSAASFAMLDASCHASPFGRAA